MRSYALASVAGMCLLYLVGAAGVVNPSISTSEGTLALPPEALGGLIEGRPARPEKQGFEWLRASETLYIPLVENGAHLLHGRLATRGGESDDFESLTPLTGSLQQHSEENLQVAFTTPALLAEGVMYREIPTEELLRRCLYDERLDGLVVNPPINLISSVDAPPVLLDPFDLVEAIGMIHSESAPSDYLSAAAEAYRSKDYFAAVFLSERSMHSSKLTQKEYYEAERLKLRSYLKLNFPGSLTRARSELLWFEREYGLSKPLAELQARLAQGSGTQSDSPSHHRTLD